MTICPWCSNSLLDPGEVQRGACAVCRPQITRADLARLPHAEPPDPRAPTIPAPPPTLDMATLDE